MNFSEIYNIIFTEIPFFPRSVSVCGKKDKLIEDEIQECNKNALC
jgi:hypothetical protein